ncbi:MAG: hypothetical protein AAF411_24065, partial [Myxococcota bacterium]
MNRSSLFLTGLLLAGCFDSDSTTPPTLRDCFEVDAVGCCGSVQMRVPIEDVCPAGTAAEGACRTAGCETSCTTPLVCRADVGGACCGDTVFNTSCDSCPAGSIPQTSCIGNFPTDCGCDDGRRRFIPPPIDGGAGGAPIADAGLMPEPPSTCFEDLGGGCCGAPVAMGPCGCPAGTLIDDECSDFGGAGDRIVESCRVGTEGGCCGAFVEPNACGICPEGTVRESLCGDAGGEPRPFIECRIDVGGGCCGEVVSPDSCGGCPLGSVTSDFCDAVL